MKNNNYKVYIHKNKINGKIYVGITSQSVNQRWRNGTNYYGNEYFNRAIKKYGWNNFEHLILFEGLTKEEAENKEIELIKYYNSTNRNNGYNIENGGSAKGKHSEETIKKISESQKGGLNHMAKKVICLNNKKVFNSMIEASEYAGCSISTLRKNCNDKNNSAGLLNYEKLTWMYLDDYSNLINKEEYVSYKINKTFLKHPKPQYNHELHCKKIICLNHNKCFNSEKEACNFYNIKPSNLTQALNGGSNGIKIDDDFLIFDFLKEEPKGKEQFIPLYLTRGATLKIYVDNELYGFYPSIKYFCENIKGINNINYDITKIRYYINNHEGIHKNIKFEYSTHREYIKWYYNKQNV